MKKDHKGLMVKMTEQEKLVVKKWHERESREEKDQMNQERMGRSMGSIRD